MANCLTPIFVRGLDITAHDSSGIQVPCGKCPACFKRRISGWTARLMYHERDSVSAKFVTLTYANGNANRTPNKFLTLTKSHCQQFFNKLRKYEQRKLGNKRKISYYIAGEYGSKRGRPHYHAIIFNASDEGINASWHFEGQSIGNIHIGQVTNASVGYTLKYMFKPSRIPLHRKDDRIPEFSLMSKGLGKSYLTPEMVNWHKADLQNRFYLPISFGKKAPLPRYLKLKIYTPEEMLVIQAKMILLASAKEDAFIKAYGPRAPIIRELYIKREFLKFERKNDLF